ncbi:UNVERIFIED_CONTAM: hypothetical protein NCL1_16661 [Trichonephila clavipes]
MFEICSLSYGSRLSRIQLLNFARVPTIFFESTVERRLSERLLSGASNIRTSLFLATACTVYEYVFEQYNAQQLFRVRPKVTGKPKHSFIMLERRYDEEDEETWMRCDAEDCGFQMLNDDEIVTSVQEESGPVDDETNEDEDNNNNESSKGP